MMLDVDGRANYHCVTYERVTIPDSQEGSFQYTTSGFGVTLTQTSI